MIHQQHPILNPFQLIGPLERLQVNGRLNREKGGLWSNPSVSRDQPGRNPGSGIMRLDISSDSPSTSPAILPDRLKRLWEQGLITEGEYSAKKKELLDRL